jgi:hypothetical protein
MKLRSKLNPTSVESNLVSIKVGKYNYYVDLLTLIVYDENNTKYTIQSLLEKILLLESQVVEEKTKLKDFIAKQGEVNKNLQSAFEACSKYIKSLQDQNIKLQNELNNLKEGK